MTESQNIIADAYTNQDISLTSFQSEISSEPLYMRHFTKVGVCPYDAINFELRDCEIKHETGQVVFTQKDIEVPEFWSQMATTIVASKYFNGALKSSQRESSVKQLIDRVVNTLTKWGSELGYFENAQDGETFSAELKYILINQYAAFNSPVWFNLGVEAHPQCSACFILDVEDSMESLLELQKQEGILFKSGSGCGSNLSKIRSSREKLSGGGVPSGPLSFMKALDAWAGSIKSGGKTRRAAKMQILNVDHPDIMEFIECKWKEEKKAHALLDAGYDGGFGAVDGAYDSVSFQNANLSIRVTDEFMEAVLNDQPYYTKQVLTGENCQSLNAREVLKKAAKCAHLCGDPGIQFDTTINEWHTCPNSGRINSSNPCSEYMHLDNSACNLASINLLKFLDQNSEFDHTGFCRVVDLLITAQDILIDKSRYPTKAIERCSRDYRQLGLGYSNLGALLMCCGLAYDSDDGRQLAAAITALMSGQAYSRSAKLANKLGAFRGFKKNQKPMLEVIDKHANSIAGIKSDLLAQPLLAAARKSWQEAQYLGQQFGYRNSQVTVLAPTGTIAFMMDCDTTGIEPDIALVKYKKLSGGGMLKMVNRSVSTGLKKLGYDANAIQEIVNYIDKNDTIEEAPYLNEAHLSVFDCAFKAVKGQRSITPAGHLLMMAAVQPFLSGAISKTVNIPHEASDEELFNTFVQAWRLGLKAVAVYRDGSKRMQPLSTATKTDSKTSATLTIDSAEPVRRRLPAERAAVTHKFSIAGLDGYLTVGLYPDEQPGEIFLVVAKEGSTLSGMTDAFATSISLALQYGVPLATLVKKFTFTRFEPAGFTGNPNIPSAHSIIDYIFRWLAWRFLSIKQRKDLGIMFAADFNDSGGSLVKNGVADLVKNGDLFLNQEDAPICTRCGSNNMIRQGSCYTCLSCGNQGGCG